MTRAKRASRQRVGRTAWEANTEGEQKGQQYAGAFARVRLVRAWVAAVAAIVAMLSGYVALLERLLTWWSAYPGSGAGTIRDWYSVIP